MKHKGICLDKVL